MGLLDEIRDGVIKGSPPDRMKALARSALEQGVKAEDLLNLGLIQAMQTVGERFRNREVYVPEVLLSARSMVSALEIAEPVLAAAKVKSQGRVLLGTVKGDIHNIGKNLVGIMLKGAGFEVVDVGVDVPPDKFVAAAQDNVQLVCLSCLLTTCLPNMKATVEAIGAAGLKGKVKVIVGGAVVTRAFADKVGANGYAADAMSAVAEARGLLKA